MHVSATRLPQMLKPADGFPSRRTDAGVEKYKRRVNQKLFSLIIIRADIGNPSKMEVEIRGV